MTNYLKTEFDRLENYLLSKVAGNEKLQFDRRYKENHRTYLRVDCLASIYDKLKNAVDCATREILMENLQCNIRKGKMYFNAYFDSYDADHKFVKRMLIRQNTHIHIQSWVFVTEVTLTEEPVKFRLIFSVPISDLNQTVSFINRKLTLREWQGKCMTNRFNPYSSLVSFFYLSTVNLNSTSSSSKYTDKTHSRKRAAEKEPSDSQTQAKRSASNSATNSAAQIQRRGTRKEEASTSHSSLTSPSTSTAHDWPRELNQVEINATSQIIQHISAQFRTLFKILEEIKNLLYS